MTRRPRAARLALLLTALAGACSGAAAAAASEAGALNSPMVTVIIHGNGQASPATVAAAVRDLGGRLTDPLGILDGGIAVMPSAQVATLMNDSWVETATPDGKLQLDSTIGSYDPTADIGSLYNTEQIAGIQSAWSQGATGQGVGVALIDTGVTPVRGLNGDGQVWNGPDLSFDSQNPELTQLDEFGHGTHMAGIIAGNDTYRAGTTYAGNASQFTGVAPDSHIINVKAGDENGVVDVSQVLAAIDWVVQHRNDPGVNIRVLNLSFGTDSVQSYVLDPLAFAAETAWHDGIVVVAAVGNGGNSTPSVNDPSNDPYVIAVGAADTQGTLTTSDDTVASFSAGGNLTRTPDVVAPGVHIESLRDPGSEIDEAYGSVATVGSPPRFFKGSGTSQATAVVSGAAADILSAHPSWSPDQVKYALTNSATHLNGEPATLQGSGEINVGRALNTAPLLPVLAKQTYVPSTGLGTLEGSRGTLHVISSGVTLSGEQDIFGNSFNSPAMAAAEANGASWAGGTWNGASWGGASWAGTNWQGASWGGASWAGTSWANGTWAGASWGGASWGGASWGGASWGGASWGGASWGGVIWSGASWGGASWGGASWGGASWAGTGWATGSWA
ncbi:MAG: S8 family serine peptidase [Candidatus Dormibacteraeota bacterium]|nr:S8 family serine peptidase [Candidatus Dormibacteraeota bacterium]